MPFIPLAITPGHICSVHQSAHPVELFGWQDQPLQLDGDLTHFGMVTASGALLEADGRSTPLDKGMFFVHYGALSIRGGRGLVIARPDYQGYPQIGGPLEPRGRLNYIDGCSDSLLVCPPRLGEPCLNHLHIPAGTDQTRHSHPSDRIGVIMAGSGECRTPEANHPLADGMAWVIPAGSKHAFFTSRSSLDVIAWHPDSDFGPRDEDHPMINRTCI
jgi:hypothetical protein